MLLRVERDPGNFVSLRSMFCVIEGGERDWQFRVSGACVVLLRVARETDDLVSLSSICRT